MIEATDATLTRIEKNQILKAIHNYGPSPSDFQWTDKDQEEYYSISSFRYRVSVLTHRPTGYYCVFGAHSITTSPGLTKKVEPFSHEHRWDKKENICTKWLIVIKLEADAPDLWATIAQETSLPVAASSANIDNRRFRADEQNLISAKLDQIKGYLVEAQQFDVEQAERIEREFAYLRESATRLGRKDWLNNVLGGMFGLAVNLALAPDKAKELLRLAGMALQSLWAIGQNYLN
jgi:hypothetical protein